MPGARQPIELIVANGKKHLTKKEIEERRKTEPKINKDNIIAPEYLSEAQSKKFYEISNELVKMEIMSNLDCDVLARLVVAEELYEMLSKRMMTEEVRSDIFELEKTANLQDKYYKQCMSASKELGLTISSRCKISVPKKELSENKLLRALGDG